MLSNRPNSREPFSPASQSVAPEANGRRLASAQSADENIIEVFGADDDEMFGRVFDWTVNSDPNVPRICLSARVAANLMIAAKRCAAPEDPRETIGVLYGEAGIWNQRLTIFITGALWTWNASATLAEVQISPELFVEVFNQEGQSWPRRRRVGWFHSHPGWGLSFSSRDRENQSVNFDMPWQVGLLLETSQEMATFYVWDHRNQLSAPQSFRYADVVQQVTSCDQYKYTDIMRQLNSKDRSVSIKDQRLTYFASKREMDRIGFTPLFSSPTIEENDPLHDIHDIRVLGRQRGERNAGTFEELSFDNGGEKVLLIDRSLAADLFNYMYECGRRDSPLIPVGYLGGEWVQICNRKIYIIHTAVVGACKPSWVFPTARALESRWRAEMGSIPHCAHLCRWSDERLTPCIPESAVLCHDYLQVVLDPEGKRLNFWQKSPNEKKLLLCVELSVEQYAPRTAVPDQPRIVIQSKSNAERRR